MLPLVAAVVAAATMLKQVTVVPAAGSRAQLEATDHLQPVERAAVVERSPRGERAGVGVEVEVTGKQVVCCSEVAEIVRTALWVEAAQGD